MADEITLPLALEGVSYRYPAAKTAADDAVSRGVEDVSLSLAAGEALGLLGPNGSGKSTILSLVAGLLAPRSGSVRLLGEPVSAPVRRRLGVVFQEPSLDPLMTVAEDAAAARAPVRPGRDQPAAAQRRPAGADGAGGSGR